MNYLCSLKILKIFLLSKNLLNFNILESRDGTISPAHHEDKIYYLYNFRKFIKEIHCMTTIMKGSIAKLTNYITLIFQPKGRPFNFLSNIVALKK